MSDKYFNAPTVKLITKCKWSFWANFAKTNVALWIRVLDIKEY